MKNSRQSILFLVLLIVALATNGIWFFVVRTRLSAMPGTAEPSREMLPYAALGSNMAENNRIRDLQWSEPQFEAFLAGMRASYEGRGYPFDDEARELNRKLSERVQSLLTAEHPDPTETYFRALREKENVLRTASGLHYRITHDGDGGPPRPGDTVVVSYAARTPDGRALSVLSGVRLQAGVADLLPGLAEGVQLLKPGAKALVYVPASLSFGDGDWPADVPRGMPVGFFLELHEVVAK